MKFTIDKSNDAFLFGSAFGDDGSKSDVDPSGKPELDYPQTLFLVYISCWSEVIILIGILRVISRNIDHHTSVWKIGNNGWSIGC